MKNWQKSWKIVKISEEKMKKLTKMRYKVWELIKNLKKIVEKCVRLEINENLVKKIGSNAESRFEIDKKFQKNVYKFFDAL